MKQMGINDGHDNNRAADMLKNNLSGRASTMADYMKQAKILKLTNVNKQAVELKADTEGATITINGITVNKQLAPYISYRKVKVPTGVQGIQLKDKHVEYMDTYDLLGRKVSSTSAKGIYIAKSKKHNREILQK